MQMDHSPSAIPCSLTLAPGWRAEERRDAELDSDFVAIVPPTGEVLLRLSTFDLQRAKIDAAEWTEVTAGLNRSRGREVMAVRCGDFSGYRTRFAPGDGRWLTGWMLHAGAIPLDVNFDCALQDAGRYDAAVDAMLATLRAKRRTRAVPHPSRSWKWLRWWR
jgi:hypothetical protein